MGAHLGFTLSARLSSSSNIEVSSWCYSIIRILELQSREFRNRSLHRQWTFEVSSRVAILQRDHI